MAADRHPAAQCLRARGLDLPDHHPLRQSGPGLRRTTGPSTARRSPPAPSRRSSASRWPCSGSVFFVPMIALCLPVGVALGRPADPPGPAGPVGHRGGHDHLPDHRRALHHQGHLPVVLIGPPDHLHPVRDHRHRLPRRAGARCTERRDEPLDERPRDRSRVGAVGTTDPSGTGGGPDRHRRARPSGDQSPPGPASGRNRTARFAWGAVVVILIGVVVLIVYALTDRRCRRRRRCTGSRPRPPWWPALATVPGAASTPSGSPRPCPHGATHRAHRPAAADRRGKPEVLFVGAEFCPFCAAERWPLIVALSRFGHFSTAPQHAVGPALGLPRASRPSAS